MIQTAAIDTTVFRLDAISLMTKDAMGRLIKLAKAKAGATIKLGLVAVLSRLSASASCARSVLG